MLLRLLPRLPKLCNHALSRTPFRFLHTTMPTRAQDFRIELSKEEKKLFALLVDCARWIDEHPGEVDQLRVKDEEGEWVGELRGSGLVELRIAGGWVRDKVSWLFASSGGSGAATREGGATRLAGTELELESAQESCFTKVELTRVRPFCSS